MAKKAEEALQKHTLLLYEGDYKRLQDMFPDIGASIVIRKIIREYLNKVQPLAKVKAPNIQL